MSWLWQLLTRFGRLFVWWTVVMPWEQALRVRLGRRTRLLMPGAHLCIPYVDAVFRQSTRLRLALVQPQTLSTVDGKVLVVAATVAYAITDLQLLYESLHHAEDTIANLVAGAIARDVTEHTAAGCSALEVELRVKTFLDLGRYGLSEVAVRLTDFAFVRAYRLVTDAKWGKAGDGLDTSQADGRPS